MSTRDITKELYRLRKARSQPVVPPMPWTARAACQGRDPDQWMEEAPGPGVAAAKAVCAACPVRAACLAHALTHDEPWGIWGGLTTRQRVALRLGLPVPSDVPDAARPYMGARGPRATKPSPARRAS